MKLVDAGRVPGVAVDADAGTVRLKQGVDKADEMALDTRSTKTTRIRREGPAAAVYQQT